MLRAIGVHENDERVYRALLGHPDGPVERLAEVARCPADETVAALARLERLGLIRSYGGKYVAAYPEAAVNTIVQRLHAEIDRVWSVSDELVEEFRAGYLSAHPARLVEMITGPDAVSQRSRDLFLNTTERVMIFDQPPYVTYEYSLPYDEVAAEIPLLERGVRVRVIYSGAALELPGRLDKIRRLAEAGEQARTLPRLPIKLRIYDQSAIVPLISDEQATQSMAVIHKSGLFDAMVALFEAYWRRAYPVGATPPVDPGDRRWLIGEEEWEVLSLLDAGFTDEAIARQLGVSMRTVGRRVRNILDALDVSTRFQAGRQAHRLGWLPRHDRGVPPGLGSS